MAAIVGQAIKYALQDTASTVFGSWIIPEFSGVMDAWNSYDNCAVSTSDTKIGLFTNVNTAGQDQPGTLIAESNAITINTTDTKRRWTFSSPPSVTGGTKYWVLKKCSVTHSAWYSGCDSPPSRTYVNSAPPAYALSWDSPQPSVNGSTVNLNNITVTGWAEITQTVASISYIGTCSIPVDDAAASNTSTTNTWTNRFNDLQVGDIIYAYPQQRGSATMSIGVAAGQTWSSFTNVTGTNISVTVLYCRFNGTWSTDPRFDFSAGTNTSVVIEAYRPPNSTDTWAVDQAQASGTFNATGTTKTITGITTAQANTVTIAIWATADDNSWESSSGTGWYGMETSGFGQSRNIAGSDQSMTVAHKIQTSAGATGNVVRNQSVNGADAGITIIFSMYTITASSGTNFKTRNGLTKANTKVVNGLAIASVKLVVGL